MIITILIFILVLSILVFVHELGHFLVAKRAGVRVEEFGLGLPPKILGKKVGETIYSINLLPFGGFVKLSGEDAEGDIEEALKDPRNFLSKKPLVRAGILTAGVFMNLIFATFFYQIFLTLNGYQSNALPLFVDYKFRFGNEKQIDTVVVGVAEGSPAQQAGISPGEAIIEIDDRPVNSVTDIRSIVGTKVGQPTKLLLMNVTDSAKRTRVLTLTPALNEEGKGQLGVGLSSFVVLSYENGIAKILAGPLHAYNMTSYTAKVFSDLVLISFKSRDLSPVSSGVSGPLGIFGAFTVIMEGTGKGRVLSLVDFISLLSLSLGIINLLPFPALDGGRLVFVVFEGITGRRVNPLVERWVHTIGMAILLLLLGVVTLSDITRFR